DRRPSVFVLALTLLVAATSAVLIPPLHRWLQAHDAFGPSGLIPRIVFDSGLLFLLPVVALGAVSPQVLRLSLPKLEMAGKVAGKLYAWSTVGALAGSFLTGWVLIRVLGVYRLVLLSSFVLVVLAAGLVQVWRRPRMLAPVAAPVLLAFALAWSGQLRSP